MEETENKLELRKSLFDATALVAEYCSVLENVREMERDEFVRKMLSLLPKLYSAFLDFDISLLPEEQGDNWFRQYVDEDYYETVRRNVGSVMGEEDVFLETFEEDMKYSDTPIASSVSENLADIFQPLGDYLSIVRESDGELMADAFRECRSDFESYWSQTLCNVLKALNNINRNQQ